MCGKVQRAFRCFKAQTPDTNQPLELHWSCRQRQNVAHHHHHHIAVTVTYTVLRLQKNAHSGSAVPHHCQTDSRFYYQVQANPSYPVLYVRAVFQIFLCVIPL